MMKFLIAIVMVALFGFSLTSAAAVDLGNNDVAREELDDFKENLQNLLSEVSKQIKENVNFEDAADVESFLQENKMDDEQDSIVTEEEEELLNVGPSDSEDDQSGENVESGISCRWHGRTGRCCQSIKIRRLRLSICLTATIMPPVSMRIALQFNGRTIWRHTVASRRNYVIRLRKGSLRLEIHIYNIYVSSHSARACLSVKLKFHFIRITKRLGCFSRRFADDKISSAKEDTPLQLLEKKENINNLFLVPNDNKPTDDVFRFDN